MIYNGTVHTLNTTYELRMGKQGQQQIRGHEIYCRRWTNVVLIAQPSLGCSMWFRYVSKPEHIANGVVHTSKAQAVNIRPALT